MKRNDDKQLTLPLYPNTEVEYKAAIKQNWKFTFSRQHITSVHAKRVIGLTIAQMKEEGEMRDVYHIRAADVIRETGLQKAQVYKTMRQIIFELINVAFIFESEKGQTILPRHLLDTSRFKDPVCYKNGILTLAFNPTLRDMILELAHYSNFELEAYMKFSSWYSMRFWELLSAYKDTGWWEVSIKEYRDLMGCGIEYTDKGNPRKDKKGNFKYIKYPNTSDMIKKTTSEPIRELKGTALEFVVNPIKESIGRGRPQITKLRFDLVEALQTPEERIERWCKLSKQFADMYPRMKKWKLSNENIVKYTQVLGSKKINNLLWAWQQKNMKGSRQPIDNPLKYCNMAFVAEGQKAILLQEENKKQ